MQTYDDHDLYIGIEQYLIDQELKIMNAYAIFNHYIEGD